MIAATFSASDHLLAALAACGAGLVNALAGGGTLISFPTLVALGAGRVPANTTNAVALCPGYFGGAWSQRRDLAVERAELIELNVAAGLGGLGGAILLLATGEAVFRNVVPYLILAACALLVTQGWIRKQLRIGARSDGTRSVRSQTAVAFVTSVYGGYFGAGLGIMLLAALGVVRAEPLPRLNALKQVLSLTINVVAALFFVASGNVLWTLALAMAPASLVGGWVGGRLVGRIQPTLLRALVAIYGTSLAIYYLVR